MSKAAQIATLEDDLARRIDHEDKLLLALHIGCGALGVERMELPPLCPSHGLSARACALCAAEFNEIASGGDR